MKAFGNKYNEENGTIIPVFHRADIRSAVNWFLKYAFNSELFFQDYLECKEEFEQHARQFIGVNRMEYIYHEYIIKKAFSGVMEDGK